MVARHEGFAGGVSEDGALAADRLGDEEGRRAGQPQGRRVELVELQVRDLRARHRSASAMPSPVATSGFVV